MRLANRNDTMIRIYSLSVALMLALLMVTAGCGSEPAPVNAVAHSPLVGSAGSDFLSDHPYRSLVVEFAAVQGAEPKPAAVDHLVSFLRAHLNKPAGIAVEIDSPIPPLSGQMLNLEDIKGLEAIHRRHYPNADQAAAFFLIVDQPYVVDNAEIQTFGLAYGSSAMVMFEHSISAMSLSNPFMARDALESTVLTHEFGHILGLVNMGISMTNDHADRLHSKGHCRNPKCLMYYAVNTTLSFYGNEDQRYHVPALDQECLEDLRAKGGK